MFYITELVGVPAPAGFFYVIPHGQTTFMPG